MTLEFTPGPWKSVGHQTNRFHPKMFWTHTVETASGDTILASLEAHTDNDAANARLMAASPEMFEFIKYVAETTVPDKYAHWKSQCQAIVAKIEGAK